MKNQIYWLTDSDYEDISLYDNNFKKHSSRFSFLNKLKVFIKSNQNIDFRNQEASVLLKPTEESTYQIIKKGHFPCLIHMFKYFLFEEKLALEIKRVTNNKINFEKVCIYDQEHLVKEKSYFKLKVQLREIEYKDCPNLSIVNDEMLLVSGMDLYFSESLKLKLELFFRKNYPHFKFIPGVPYLVC